MVVVDPHGSFEFALRKSGVEAFEAGAGIAVEQGSFGGDNTKIHQAVIVEISLSDIDDAGET